MAGISNDSAAYQLQYAILAVPSVGLLATMAEPSKVRMFLPSRCRQELLSRTCHDWDTTLSQRSCGTLACFGWLCLLPMVSHWAKKVVNVQVANSCVYSHERFTTPGRTPHSTALATRFGGPCWRSRNADRLMGDGMEQGEGEKEDRPSPPPADALMIVRCVALLWCSEASLALPTAATCPRWFSLLHTVVEAQSRRALTSCRC